MRQLLYSIFYIRYHELIYLQRIEKFENILSTIVGNADLLILMRVTEFDVKFCKKLTA